LLPERWGRALLGSATASRWLGRLLGPRTLRTDRVSMQLTLRCLAGLRRFRRSTLGYAHERHMRDRWYDAVLSAGTHDTALAIAALGGLVKGYGETRHRTTSRLMQILDYLEQSQESDADTISSLHLAAMAPDSRFEIGDITLRTPERV